MKIKTNLSLLSGIFVILVAMIGLIMFYTFGQVKREIGESNIVRQMIKDAFELNMVTYEYLMHHEKRMQQQWQVKYKSLGKTLNKLGKVETHSEYLSLMKSITADYELLGDLFSQLRTDFTRRKRLLEENRPQAEINFLLASEERAMAEILMRTHKMATGAFNLSAAMEQIITRTEQRANSIIIFSIIGFVIFSSFISFLTARAITNPINKLIESTEIIGKGDLKHKVVLKATGEMGQLADSFNRMAADLKVSKDNLESHSKDLEKEVRKRTRELEKARAGLEETVKKRTKELKDRVSELERYHDATTDRELRIKELREEIEKLKTHRPLEQKS